MIISCKLCRPQANACHSCSALCIANGRVKGGADAGSAIGHELAPSLWESQGFRPMSPQHRAKAKPAHGLSADMAVRSPIYGLAHSKLLARAVRPKWNGGCRPLTAKLLWANELHLRSTRIVSDVKEPALLLREDITVGEFS